MGHGRGRPEPTSSARSMRTALPRLAVALLVVAWSMAGFVASATASALPSSSSPRVDLAAPPSAKAKPSPKPKPTPPPTPPPTPAPTPAPTPPATARPTPRPTARPTPRPTPRPTSRPASVRTATPSIAPGAGTTTGGGGGPAGADPGGTPGTPGILPWLVAAAAGASFLVLVAVRRRKSDDLEVQTAAVAAPVGAASPSSSAPAESQVPRWLRPSVRAARFESDNLKAPRPDRAARLAFATPGDAVTERLVVRYDLVQLLDRPDEALGAPHDELNSGDEVEVLERDDIWTRVQTPTGRAGWIPAMTLASADALAGEPDAETPLTAERDRPDRQGDQPALETLLAIAAERRARIDAQPPTPSRPDRGRSTRKAKRRASSRAERT
jgi:hypothetical protein